MALLENLRRTRPQNFVDQSPERREPVVDFKELGRRIDAEHPQPDEGHAAYAPPAMRQATEAHVCDTVVRTIETFGALPTSEIDEVIKAAEDEIAALKKEAQIVRDDYVRRTDDLAERTRKLTQGCKLAREALMKLREDVVALHEPKPKPEQAAE